MLVVEAVITGSSQTREGMTSWGGIRMDGLEDWDGRLDGWIYLKKHLNVVNDAEACLGEDYDGEDCLEDDTLILL